MKETRRSGNSRRRTNCWDCFRVNMVEASFAVLLVLTAGVGGDVNFKVPSRSEFTLRDSAE